MTDTVGRINFGHTHCWGKPIWPVSSNADIEPEFDISHMSIEQKADICDKCLDYLWEEYWKQWPTRRPFERIGVD
jgi:hypothetical protein